MNDDRRDLEGLSATQQTLARRLDRLGPIVREQERAENEIDVAFAGGLRAHLVSGDDLTAYPSLGRTRRRQRVGSRPIRRSALTLHRRLAAGIGTTLVAAIATIIFLLIGLSQPASPAFRVPHATRADLLFNLPSSQTFVRSVRATISLIRAAPPVPYRGDLNLAARALPPGPSTVRAYRLGRPRNVVGLARRLLGIRAPTRRVTTSGATWVVARDGGAAAGQALHSVAVSLGSGELIYHDRRNFVLPRARRALSRPLAVASARSWLRELGWPAYRMPVRSVATVPGLPRVRRVVLGWIGVGPASIEEATLWVTPNRSVIEAWVWPPVVQRTSITAISIPRAWKLIRTGQVPVVVRHVGSGEAANGTGRVKRVAITEIIVTTGKKGAYLVPAYRFSGTTRLAGVPRQRSWLSLAPGAP